ncbi:MAG TPA: plasmid pRiA4b ORF-3 family protein [Synergistales bacterium]|nr:plasmid pRiA4b ORF-3 family protein [Synergistales bacterium]
MEGNLQIHVELEGIAPKVWRRFVVPSSITLDRLSDVIQIVMGWSGEHMHVFNINGKDYMDQPDDVPDAAEEGLFRLGSLLPFKGSEFTYTYDLGDNWVHLLKIEKTGMEDDEEWGDLFCVNGKGACPPDDIGGLTGFTDFLRAMGDREDPQHEFFIDWYGGEFDPNAFELLEINITLLFFLRWSRDRCLPWWKD